MTAENDSVSSERSLSYSFKNIPTGVKCMDPKKKRVRVHVVAVVNGNDNRDNNNKKKTPQKPLCGCVCKTADKPSEHKQPQWQCNGDDLLQLTDASTSKTNPNKKKRYIRNNYEYKKPVLESMRERHCLNT